ncbi:hypothetical protein BKH12_04660 [Actinomyces naeslundii]|nr:hypothetical protein BKH12_04660 [Actinomyces naeslundii]
MINWRRDLRRAITVGILVWLFLTYFDDLITFLKMFIAASPSTRAQIVSFIVILIATGYIFCTLIKVMFSEVVDLIKHKLGSSDGTPCLRSSREIYAEIHKYEGESVEEAVKRLEPLWNQRELGEDISITQRRRHEAAHAVITHALGGTVKSADVHQQGNVGGNVEYFPPIPSAGPAHTMWVRLQIAVAGAAQDSIDGILNAGSSTDIDKALCQAVTLTAAAWTPDGYTGPLNPSDLITHAIEVDKQLLAERQHAVAAIETALTDKDKLAGVEVHEILDNLNTPLLEPAVEVVS